VESPAEELEEASVSVRVTRWDLARSNVELMFTSKGTWTMALTSVLGFAAWAILRAQVHATPRGLLQGIVAGLIFATAMLVIGYVPVFLLVVVGSRESHGILGDRSVAFRPDGVRVQTAAEDQFYEWRDIHKVRRTRANIIIYLSRFRAHILPKRCFASVEAFDESWSTIQRLKKSASRQRA
jgi:hypothetical protein